MLLSFFFFTGYPVSSGERSSPEHPRGHCTVPLQRRGAQQNSHRGLLRGTVSSPDFPLFFFHLFFFALPISLSDLHCMRSDEGIKPQEIVSLDLWSRAATGDRASKITERTCGSYRREINGHRTVKTTGFSCCLAQPT